MARPVSMVAPGWWDYTTLDRELLDDAASLSARDLKRLARPGFEIEFYDTLESFYLAEALEYIEAWRQATPAHPAGICGPIGPTEQLPLGIVMSVVAAHSNRPALSSRIRSGVSSWPIRWTRTVLW